MRKIKEVLRLYFDSSLSQRAISRCMGISRTTIGDYLDRAEEAGLGWPLPESLTDQELEQQIFPSVLSVSSAERLVPDWPKIQEDLQRKGVTLMLLWEADTDFWLLGVVFAAIGWGMGTVVAPATDAVMGAVPEEKAGVASAMNSTVSPDQTTTAAAITGAATRPMLPASCTSPAALVYCSFGTINVVAAE